MERVEEQMKNTGKKRKNKQKTVLSRGLGKISKLLAVAVLIHYTIVLFQGDYHPMINSAREWITTYIYNGPLAGLVQPACARIWGWKYSALLYDLTGLPALEASVTVFLIKRYIEHIIADEKPTYHAIASMFIKQVYEILVGDAQGKPEERLPKPVYFIIDEFGNIPRIENMSNIITAARSRNIFCTLVVQSYHQLRRIYGHDAETIKANCQNWFYLFSRELSILNEISELCGDIRTAEGGVRRLISVSELQRFKMGEMLVMHDRLYPYVTYMPDISEYRLKSYPEMPKKAIEARYNEIVKIENLIQRIQVGDLPVAFKSEVPAIKQAMERANGKMFLSI